jgi:hypothetical protein
MLDHLLMLSLGWVGGVVSTLLIRHALDGRQALDPALLPAPSISIPTSRAKMPPQVGPPPSPYAPKKVLPKPTQRTEQLLRVWQAAKQDRPTSWNATKTATNIPKNIPAPGHGAHQGGGREIRGREHGSPAAPSTSELLPSIAWGTPHDGQGQTPTKEVRAKTSAALAENGHRAQAPRRRSSS